MVGGKGITLGKSKAADEARTRRALASSAFQKVPHKARRVQGTLAEFRNILSQWLSASTDPPMSGKYCSHCFLMRVGMKEAWSELGVWY